MEVAEKILNGIYYRRSFKEKGFDSIYQGQKLPPPGSPNSTGSVKDPLQATSWKHMLDEKIEEKKGFISRNLWIQTLVRVSNIFSLIIQKMMCKIAIHTVWSRDIVPRGGPLFVFHENLDLCSRGGATFYVL